MYLLVATLDKQFLDIIHFHLKEVKLDWDQVKVTKNLAVLEGNNLFLDVN